MTVARMLVFVVTLVAVAMAPMWWGHSRPTPLADPVHAATAPGGQNGGGLVRQDNDDDDGDNEDADNDDADDGDNEDADNENADDNDNGDEAEEPANGGVAAGPIAAAPGAPGTDAFPSVRCYDVGMVGAIDLNLAGGGVTLTVVPASSFGQVTEVALRAVDPATVPAPPGALLQDFVFSVDALNGCGGSALDQLPSPVNLGVTYVVPADKSRLQLARWDGVRWVDVPTVPDSLPDNPYVSATIQQAGTYAVHTR